jgi:nucleoside-diphosphate-sugar epimerase
MSKKKVLITGAGGRIGSVITPMLSNMYNLRLLDTMKLKPHKKEEVVTGDIRDATFLKSAMEDIDAIVHLAAIPDEDDFYTKLMPINIEGTYTLLETARRCGVKKVILASTCQIAFGYPNSTFITTDMAVRPVNLYSCTKIFGEAVGRYYSDKFGISVICLRIGYFQNYDSEFLQDSEVRKKWCSPKDLVQIIEKSIDSKLKYGVFFAISNNKGRVWDIEDAKQKLNYDPIDGTQ